MEYGYFYRLNFQQEQQLHFLILEKYVFYSFKFMIYYT